MALIEVKHLTKRYGGHTAVSDLSFTIEPGVIYGFLGPNGAGKSTTMNIITGCLGATSGEVTIDGHSIMDEPMAAKKKIGYLPEQPPLYIDMTAEEYLRFVMKARHVPREAQCSQLARVMQQTKLLEVRDRLIRNLSKGYRQRVGIAQALLGEPEVIILDEPTVGLDPAQIIEIRQLIRELGKKHTIVLSSHILSEVQAVCDRIMIISRGRLVASDSTENLTALFAGTAALHLETRASRERIVRALNHVDGVESFHVEAGEDGARVVRITAKGSTDLREAIFMAFAAEEAPLLELRRESASLEEVFLELTSSEAGDMVLKTEDSDIHSEGEEDEA